MDNYRDNLEMEKKNRPKYLMWGRRMHLCIRAYHELLNWLVAMENNKEDIVVVLAGYKDKMDKFYGFIPGMNSRIGNHIEFPNYEADELVEELGDLRAQRPVGQPEHQLRVRRAAAQQRLVELRHKPHGAQPDLAAGAAADAARAGARDAAQAQRVVRS